MLNFVFKSLSSRHKMTPAEEKARLKKLGDSTPGYKSWVTRSISSGEAAIECLLSGDPTPAAVATLEKAIHTVSEKCKKLEKHIEEIIELDPSQTEELFAELDVYENGKRKFHRQANDALRKSKTPGEQPLAAPRYRRSE